MIKIINDLPSNVLGISAEGEVSGKDYETILIPAIEEKLKTNKKISFLYYLGDNFAKFDMAAMFDDAKVGMKHLFVWDKIAMVSNHHVLNSTLKFFGYMIPCEVRVFKNEELEEAKKWVSTTS